MCIVCNVTIGPTMDETMAQNYLAENFLHEFALAQQHMKAAAEKMLAVSKIAA